MCPARGPPSTWPSPGLEEVFCARLWKIGCADGGLAQALCQPSSLSSVAVPDCRVVPSSAYMPAGGHAGLTGAAHIRTRADHGVMHGSHFDFFDSSPHPHTTAVQHQLRLTVL